MLLALLFLAVPIYSTCYFEDSELFGRCYQFNNHSSSFIDAKLNCTSRGFTLTRIENLTLAHFIGSIAVEKFGETYGSYWIGLSRHQNSSNFQWEDQHPLDFLNWADGYPFSGYDYVAARLSDTQWITLLEPTRLPYICSYDAIEDDTTTEGPKTTKGNGYGNGCQKTDLNLENRCYSFNRQLLSVDDARKSCEKIGKTLAVFDDFYQINFVSSFAQSQFAATYTSFWIGLQRASASTPFYWPSGNYTQFTNWSPGYPFSNQLFVAQQISDTKWKTYTPDSLLFSVCSGIL
ncbi:unnamed protein product [Caenorhabditis angaria]|uniref:C-type lectin domain-containing protein n=1 Tax=Caenorhabditis angaria TaxID=860376 RepID=A0A9P1IKS9_9PELO|nr:unnamed protein product [Caenorhabditis angaria]